MMDKLLLFVLEPQPKTKFKKNRELISNNGVSVALQFIPQVGWLF